ncbi:MAG TPA: phosphoenolpyruvate carboxykinase (ATP), partial [Gemmatimonadaceae bacterium]|nr:phosphoenolpyruvate carboxykinase (ATP) [Gemmatimonadaceae bacterium]
KYARMLGDLLARHEDAHVWLVNTGWSGGPYGVGKRMKLAYTRAMVRAALSGQLDTAKAETDPVFGLAVPAEIPGVPREVMRPRDTWKDGAAYDEQAKRLAEMFRKNIEKFGEQVDAKVRAAGPKG